MMKSARREAYRLFAKAVNLRRKAYRFKFKGNIRAYEAMAVRASAAYALARAHGQQARQEERAS